MVHIVCEGIDKKPNGWNGEKDEYIIFQDPDALGVKFHAQGGNAAACYGYPTLKAIKAGFRYHNWGGIKWTKVNEPLTKMDIYLRRKELEND